MHPYTMLKDMLAALGAHETSEDLHPDVFGSYFATYDNYGHPIRLIWDGKDGWGFVQSYQSGEWINTTDFMTEGDLESVPQNHAKIEQFKQAVATLVRSAA